MKKLILALLLVSSYATAEEQSKDPLTRDEDISATKVSVKVSTNQQGLYKYLYTVNSPSTNKGTIMFLVIDLGCRYKFPDADVS